MKFRNYSKVLFLTVSFILFGKIKTYSQQIYATTATELSSGNHVDNESNAAANNGNFAVVNSDAGIAAGIGSYSGELKLEFPSLVPANTTTYIRIDDGGKGLLDFLLGGSLGGVLSNVLGTVVLGDHYVIVSALDASGTSVVSGRSDNLTSSGVLKVVSNKNGDYFFAITPTVTYKSVTIKDVSASLVGLTNKNFINVHHAFYLDPTATSCDSGGIFTFYDGTGITLGLLGGGVGPTGVKNPEFAIDNNDATHSEISIGAVSVLATMYQEIQFPTLAATTDQLEINIRGSQGAVVNVAVLQNISIDLYKQGTATAVYSTTVDAADLLALLPSSGGDIRKIAIKPGVEFDKLRVTLTSPVGVNLAQQVDLFGVKLTLTPPTTTKTAQSFCAISNPRVSDLLASATGSLVWYDKATGGTAYAMTDALSSGKYYAANKEGSCESSSRLEVTVTISKAKDIVIQGNKSDICFGSVETYQVPTGYGPYTWKISGGTIVSGGTTTDNTIKVKWISLTNTKVSVDITGGCVKTNSIEQVVDVVTCSDLTITKKVDNINPNVEDVITFNIEVKNSSVSVFTDVAISDVLASGFRYLSHTASLGTYSESSGLWNIQTLGANQSATLKIKVKVNTSGDYLNVASIINSMPIDSDTTNNSAEVLVKPSCLQVYNLITPNGDGINDYLIISCIENYNNAVLEVYDRYGSIVYKMKNYKNDWNGEANQTGKIIKRGQKLPNGTYFYVIKFNDGKTKDKKGWIQITK